MKKFFLSAFLLGTATLAANAQANSLLVYGNAGYHSAKNDDGTKFRSYNISPGIGYQFDNHWTVGVYGSFGSFRNRSNQANSAWNFSNNYEAGAFVRHTIGLGKIFAIFNQLNAGYIGSTFGQTGDFHNTSANGFKTSLTPNIGVNVYRGFALNFNIGGIDYNTMNYNGNSSQTFNVTFGTQLNVGISKNFGLGPKHHGVKTNPGGAIEDNETKEGQE